MRVGSSVTIEQQEAVQTTEPKRRGVTAMEYLFMTSLIIVVVIIGVQHVASVTGKLLSNSAEATKKTTETAD